MQTLAFFEASEGIARWVPMILTGVFLIHTVAFIVLYFKRRHFYTLLLAIAFPFLVAYYLLKCFQVEFVGMAWIRWTGIILATIALLIIVKDFVEKKILKKTTAS